MGLVEKFWKSDNGCEFVGNIEHPDCWRGLPGEPLTWRESDLRPQWTLTPRQVEWLVRMLSCRAVVTVTIRNINVDTQARVILAVAVVVLRALGHSPVAKFDKRDGEWSYLYLIADAPLNDPDDPDY